MDMAIIAELLKNSGGYIVAIILIYYIYKINKDNNDRRRSREEGIKSQANCYLCGGSGIDRADGDACHCPAGHHRLLQVQSALGRMVMPNEEQLNEVLEREENEEQRRLEFDEDSPRELDI